jgi:hypothetical protein
MNRRLMIATLVVAGIGLAAYLVVSKSNVEARPINTQSPSDATRCAVASFNPQVFCLHGSADSLLRDLDELEHHYFSRRVYA